MNAVDRQRFAQLDERLAAIERNQRAQVDLLRGLLNLFEDITAERRAADGPRPGARHLRLVRDERPLREQEAGR